jgi:GH24 family phage-related lysozyme (muramidase)
MAPNSYQSITNWLIPEFEGFSAVPYWDVSRWSWGYGTAAPGGPDDTDPATGQPYTITREQAISDSNRILAADYAFLSPKLTRSLNANQWAAWLSFAYNLGLGNADNLIQNINSGDDAALQSQWLQYVHSGGQVNQDLVNRRNKEWQIWSGQV